jgi:hypothetical membrane protein
LPIYGSEEVECNLLKWPISCIAGILVIIFYCAFTFTSWALYPISYNPVDNWLSDLGNSSSNPNGAIFFNAGCVLTGIALFPFFIGLYKWYTEEKWRKISLIITQTLGSLAAFSLMMIGVFSQDYGEMHHLWSAVFFVLNLVVLILAGVSLFTHPKYIRQIAYYGFTVAIINLIFVSVYNIPLLEWLTVFTALGYVGLLAYNMFKAKF